MASTATEILLKEWEKTNRIAEFQNSTASALKASMAPYDLSHKSSLFSVTSAVQKAIEAMDSLRHTNHSIAQKVGRGLADYDFRFRKFDLGPVAESMSSLSILKDSLAMHKLSQMGIWDDSEKNQEVAKAVQRMLEPLRGLDTIRDSFAAQASVKFGAIAELQKSMERYSTVNIAQKASMSMLGLSALQESIGFRASAVQQAVKTMKHMRLFEESESVAKAIKQMDSLGALTKSIQALNYEGFFTRAIESFNSMPYQPCFEPAIPDNELSESISLIQSSTESDFVAIFPKLPPRIQAILILIFCRILFPIALGVAGNLMTPYAQNFLRSGKLTSSQVKTIKNTPLQDTDISNLRFVFSNNVKLRAKPSTRAEVLDVLVSGQVITVLNRKKGWAQVIYINDDDQTCRGWIMTRYTAKFKK